MPAKRTAQILKIRNGSAEHNPSRARVDVPVRGVPTWPAPMDPPSDVEERWFKYIAESLPTEFGVSDSAYIAHASRVSAHLERVERLMREHGGLVRGRDGRTPAISAHAKLARQLREEQRSCLSRLGLSPQDRLALSRRADPAPGNPWSDFDL